jgi:hypothetical protein
MNTAGYVALSIALGCWWRNASARSQELQSPFAGQVWCGKPHDQHMKELREGAVLAAHNEERGFETALLARIRCCNDIG